MNPLFSKPLESLDYSDLVRLIEDRVAEGKTIDYKRATYSSDDESKIELLRDISAFANTLGGFLVIGIIDKKGFPEEIVGIEVDNVDQEKRRLSQIIQKGLEPSLSCPVHAIKTPNDRYVLVIKAEQSWVSPHRVFYKSQDFGFWAREDSFKYPMNTNDLRRAFTLTESINDKIRAFRQERVRLIAAGDHPVELRHSPTIVFHIIPAESFRSKLTLDSSSTSEILRRFRVLGDTASANRINLDGILIFDYPNHEGKYDGFTQVFRNGVVEFVTSDVVEETEGRSYFNLVYWDKQILASVKNVIGNYLELGIQPPIWCFLSLVKMKGIYPGVMHPRRSFLPMDRDVALLSEITIDDFSEQPHSSIKTLLDMLANAFGFPRSFSYDQDGNWIGQ